MFLFMFYSINFKRDSNSPTYCKEFSMAIVVTFASAVGISPSPVQDRGYIPGSSLSPLLPLALSVQANWLVPPDPVPSLLTSG